MKLRSESEHRLEFPIKLWRFRRSQIRPRLFIQLTELTSSEFAARFFACFLRFWENVFVGRIFQVIAVRESSRSP